MLTRRIRAHVAGHNWFAVAVDLTIVVAGVFLGIQASNWNSARIEAGKAQEYRERLISEIEFNRLQYLQQLAYAQKVQGHALSLLGQLRNPSARGPAFVVDAYQATQTDIWPAKRFIYDEMVSAGMVAGIGSPRVQQLASDFYLGVDATGAALSHETPYRHLVRQLVPFEIQQRLRSECGDRLVAVEGQVVGIALADRCAPAIPPDMLAAGIARLGSQANLEQELNGHLAALEQKIGLLRLTIRQSEEALAGLNSR